MSPDLRTRLATIFKANSTLLAIDFSYTGRRGDGCLTKIVARDKHGMPLDLGTLMSPTQLPAKELLYDLLFGVLHYLAPGWVLGLGSKGTGTVNRTLDVQLTHTERQLQAMTRTIAA